MKKTAPILPSSPGRYELTIIDLFDDPARAQQEQVIADAAKTLPLPLRRLIGDFSDERRALLALDIDPTDEP